MAIEYLGLSEHQRSSWLCWKGVQDAFYDEIVEITVGRKIQRRWDVSLRFMRTRQLSRCLRVRRTCLLEIPHTRLTGHPMEIAVLRGNAGTYL